MQAYAVLARIWEYADRYNQKEMLEDLKTRMIIPEDLKDVFN
jgi:hypothetical protein